MVAPVITPASVSTIINGGAGSVPDTMAITLSASGNDRILVIVCLAKGNTATAPVVSSIVVDSAGVNRTIGSGINLQGVFQIAQEGNFSSQCGVYFCLESDLPVAAGNYNVDVTLDSNAQFNLWNAFEITGCSKQAFDAIVQNSSTTDISGGVAFSDTITPNDPDCLIIDLWSTSHSTTPVLSTSQTLVATEAGANGAFIVSQFTQVGVPTAKIMTENSTALHQRRAWNLISFSGVSGGGGTQFNQAVFGTITAGGGLVSKRTSKSFSGVVTPSGLVSTISVFQLLITGSITISGAITKRINKVMSGSITAIGIQNKLITKQLFGSINPTGTLSKLIFKSFEGSIVVSGLLLATAILKISVSGIISTIGNLSTSLFGPIDSIPRRIRHGFKLLLGTNKR